ncbi:MAG: hypothetical protein RLZZ210_740 [Pseudomonadota bacterium]|jgi:penicillin-binding protein 2
MPVSVNNNDPYSFATRLAACVILVCVCFSCLFLRLINLQIVQSAEYKAKAEENRIALLPVVPNRGLILDRNGIILARNYSTFTLEITPSKISYPLDEIIQKLSNIINIEKRDINRFKRLLQDSKKLGSFPIRSNLSENEIAKIAVIQPKLIGVEIKSRMMRNYPLNELGSHIVGHIGRISQKDEENLVKISDENTESDRYTPFKDITNYNGTSHIGKLGIEQSYEFDLHGLTGNEKVEVNASGQALRSLSTQNALSGNDIMLSVDIKLQKIVEDLYADRKGALVAINPESGEVLAFVSKPTFNPNLFVDGIDLENWKILNENPDKPLLNRALKSVYPPGSTYKPFMGLAGLEKGYLTPEKAISDPGYFVFGNHTFKDDKVGGHGAVNLYKSIVHSCDTYYYMLARDMGVDNMYDFMRHLGFGQITGIDINGESRGILPSKAWKEKYYKKPEQKRWYDGETISLGIGQGYNSFTMLQLAYATSILANNGIALRPHLVKSIYNPNQKKFLYIPIQQNDKIDIKTENLEAIIKAMAGVNIQGTSAGAFAKAEYTSAGKTGTAQVFSLNAGQKYNSKALHKDLHDHALFIVFAPIEKPKIALALIVENGGFGAQAAAPIARKVLDYVIMNKLPEEMAENINNMDKFKANISATNSIINTQNTTNITNTNSLDNKNLANKSQNQLQMNNDLIEIQKNALKKL